MNFREYLNFLFGAIFRTPSIKGMAVTMIVISLVTVLVGMFRNPRGEGGSAPPLQGRKAA